MGMTLSFRPRNRGRPRQFAVLMHMLFQVHVPLYSAADTCRVPADFRRIRHHGRGRSTLTGPSVSACMLYHMVSS